LFDEPLKVEKREICESPVRDEILVEGIINGSVLSPIRDEILVNNRI
jgi:hypothetical protein